MAFTEIRNFQGGLADSDYRGQVGSFGSGSYGLDLHDVSGLLRSSLALAKDSGATVDDLVLWSIASSNGSTYFFGDAGKIYKRLSNGTWSEERAEGERICGATEYNGYFLWAEDNKLYRMLIAGDWSDGDMTVYNAGGSAWSATLTNVTWAGAEINTSWHVMAKLGTSLYVGAGQYVTIVDSAFAVTAQGLDLPPDWIVKDMTAWNDQLLIGAYNTTKDESALFVWDGFSDSWSNQIPVPEAQIHSIVSDGQIAFVKAGSSGNLYQFNGNQVILVKQVPGTYTAASTEIVFPEGMILNNGKVLMGISKNGGNPALEGVYTFGSPNKNFPRVLDLTHVISQDVRSAVEIGSIIRDGANLFVSWKDTTGAAAYGVDKLGTSRYDNAIYETTIIGGNKPSSMTKRITLNFKKLPTSCSIDLKYQKNNSGSWTAIGSQFTTATSTSVVFSKPIKFETIQFQLTLGIATTNTPEINSIVIEFEKPGITS